METIEREDYEQRLEEAEALWRILAARINILVHEGIFTSREAQLWFDEEENCKAHPEWVQGLLDHLGDFEDSGEAVLERVRDILESSLFSSKERAVYMRYAEEASYWEKLALVGKLELVVEKRLKEKEEAKKIKYKSITELMDKIKVAISGGRLDEATALLSGMNPAENPVGYEKLSRDLEREKIVQTRNQINAMMAA